VEAESDYDINVFVDRQSEFLNDHRWLNTFDNVLVYQKESFQYEDVNIPTRLVIFENIPRIDFSFWPVRMINHMNSDRMPESYKNGCCVLIDKDEITRNLPEATGMGYVLKKPGTDEFLETIYNFWFEMMAIRKYLRKGSIWYVKTIADGPVRKLLFKMILWNIGCKGGWNRNDIHLCGKNLEEKIDSQILERLSSCFSGYGKKATIISLMETIRFFKILSGQVATSLQFHYPEKKLQKIEKIIFNDLEEL
jgi:aminoglycoside 6-adenylyltransferase